MDAQRAVDGGADGARRKGLAVERRCESDAVNLTDLVYLDDPDTWPEQVRERANAWADRLRGTTDYPSDLDLEHEDEDAFTALFADRCLVAYHATRLLDHEVAGIRANGLRRASYELVLDRIAAAHAEAAIDDELRERLVDANVFAERDSSGRENQVCAVLSRESFNRQHRGFGYLLNEWGGELIGMSSGGAGLRPQLRTLGRPAIVVAALDLAQSWKTHYCAPSLHKAFVGGLLELEDQGATVHYRADVGPERVVDIGQPGHPEYDRHVALPR